MHPIERLRSIARAHGVDQVVLVREAAGALAQLADDPGELVTACRRIVALQPAAAALWWLGARVLSAPDPGTEVWRAADEVVGDHTDRELAHALADDATVASIGLSEPMRAAALRRGDVRVLHVAAGAAIGVRGLLARGLAEGDDAATIVEVPAAGAGAAVAMADVVVVEAIAAGPGHVLAPVGALAAAATAQHCGVPVWAVAPLGRVLPAALWDALRARLDDVAPWERGSEVVDAALLGQVVRPGGLRPTASAVGAPDCGVVPELLTAHGVT